MRKIDLKKIKNSCGSTQNLARFVVQRKQGESNAHESSLRENERSEFSWQSKSRESNKNIESMTQERIKKIHKFAQSKRIVGDSQVAKMDSSLTAFAQNDESYVDCHESTNAESNDKVLARAGFGMMFAIIITIIVATLGVLAIRFSTQTLNTTTNEYIAIQLDLYLNSTTELAILYVQRNGFVCNEGAGTCDLGDNNPAGSVRGNVNAAIDKYIAYGANNEYAFHYKMTPLDNYNKYDTGVYQQVFDGTCQEKNGAGGRCFKEETKNAFILDIAGSVTNPTTNQTLRVTKRQIIKP